MFTGNDHAAIIDDHDDAFDGHAEVLLACASITALSSIGLFILAPCFTRVNKMPEAARRRPVSTQPIPATAQYPVVSLRLLSGRRWSSATHSHLARSSLQ